MANTPDETFDELVYIVNRNHFNLDDRFECLVKILERQNKEINKLKKQVDFLNQIALDDHG